MESPIGQRAAPGIHGPTGWVGSNHPSIQARILRTPVALSGGYPPSAKISVEMIPSPTQ
jgi:hypothetical protein